ncbi:hypothetical protein, variant [Saprolegnia diclina VS20]|uniref:FHA domain-containing protein n=1 Tax=Saprolegnia diclina (strain VS20) TaxID=1156394 RepID=T0PL28_SAPDV|nr:hypothetical protein, variant [Saprolegnia diclina VS20]EQC26074.1 hypothetical protein, variant [Saprolegnia diclina VS20]|eukprot:XP_008620511.1 hypothetical protein, variant [Saprolegnia diclina VS20]
MATLQLDARYLAPGSAAAFVSKGLDVIHLNPGGDSWHLDRSTLAPLLTDAVEFQALDAMADDQPTTIEYENETLRIHTSLLCGVRVNQVHLDPQTACVLRHGDRIAFLKTACGGDLVVYRVAIADGDAVSDAMLLSALATAPGKTQRKDVDTMTEQVASAESSSRVAKRPRLSSFSAADGGVRFELHLVSDSLAPSSAAALTHHRLDILRLGPHNRLMSFGQSLVAKLLSDPMELQALHDLDDDHCLFLSDRHGILRIMDTSRVGIRVNAERLEPYTPRLLDVGDTVVLLKNVRGGNLLSYTVRAAVPSTCRSSATCQRSTTPAPVASPGFEHSVVSLPPQRQQLCIVDDCEKQLRAQGRCETDRNERLRSHIAGCDVNGVDTRGADRSVTETATSQRTLAETTSIVDPRVQAGDSVQLHHPPPMVFFIPFPMPNACVPVPQSESKTTPPPAAPSKESPSVPALRLQEPSP